VGGRGQRLARSADRLAKLVLALRFGASRAALDGALLAQTDRSAAMLLTLAIILFVVWCLGFLVFHIAVGLFHLLVVFAVIALVMHFVRGGSRTPV
jgi:hypothetical protein